MDGQTDGWKGEERRMERRRKKDEHGWMERWGKMDGWTGYSSLVDTLPERLRQIRQGLR